MRSIKPGRAPSWGGVIGGIAAAIFGIFWTGGATSMGAPPFFTAFGVIFILVALGGAIYHLYNATSANRLSDWDITEHNEEPDPLDPASRNQPKVHSHPATLRNATARSANLFCPHCGNAVQAEFTFCPKCGKRLKERRE